MKLGSGGFGVVYLGLDPRSDEWAAVKVLVGLGRDAQSRTWLRREANVTQQVTSRYWSLSRFLCKWVSAHG